MVSLSGLAGAGAEGLFGTPDEFFGVAEGFFGILVFGFAGAAASGAG